MKSDGWEVGCREGLRLGRETDHGFRASGDAHDDQTDSDAARFCPAGVLRSHATPANKPTFREAPRAFARRQPHRGQRRGLQ